MKKDVKQITKLICAVCAQDGIISNIELNTTFKLVNASFGKLSKKAFDEIVEEFFEEDTISRIRSVIMVERETQKGIIIGHKGSALKRVGVEARKDLEKFFGKQVHLELYVKVNKNWRSNQNQLRRFGYNNK